MLEDTRGDLCKNMYRREKMQNVSSTEMYEKSGKVFSSYERTEFWRHIYLFFVLPQLQALVLDKAFGLRMQIVARSKLHLGGRLT
jgi:hypothetical protein